MREHVRKHEQIYNTLRKQVAAMPADTALPPSRKMMNEYGVSQLTLDKAKAQLVSEGLLVHVPGVGYFAPPAFVADGRAGQKTRVLLAFPNWDSPFYKAIWQAMNRVCDATGAVETEVFRYGKPDEIVPQVGARKCLGAVVVPDAHYPRPEALSLLTGYGFPCVFLDRAFFDVGVDSVFFDNVGAGALAAEHLLKLGHRHVAAIKSEPDVSVIRDRIRGFALYMQAAGGSCDVIDCAVRPGESAAASVYPALVNRLKKKKGDHAATAFFIDCNANAMGVFKALADMGVRIPEDMSVIGCFGGEDGALFSPALTTIGFDFDEMVRNALDTIAARLSKQLPPDDFVKCRVNAFLETRSSTCAPKRPA